MLDKPLGYFYPWFAYKELKDEDLLPLENELLLNFQLIYGENLKRLAVDLVRVFAQYDPKNLVLELAPFIGQELEGEKELKEARENRRQVKNKVKKDDK